MKINILKRFIPALLILIFFTQCTREEIDIVDCNGTIATYSTNVKAILDSNCATSGCHNTGSKKAGYDLSSYNNAKAGAEKDAFLGSIQHKSGYSKMPKGASKLSDADIQLLSCWVQNGMPN